LNNIEIFSVSQVNENFFGLFLPLNQTSDISKTYGLLSQEFSKKKISFSYFCDLREFFATFEKDSVKHTSSHSINTYILLSSQSLKNYSFLF